MTPVLFRRHYPGWATGFPARQAHASSMAEMLRIPWVRSWTKAPDFARFSVSSDGPADHCLMCELDDGATWWVLAYMDTRPDWLPEWDSDGRLHRAKEAARPAPPPLTPEQEAHRKRHGKMAADALAVQLDNLTPRLEQLLNGPDAKEPRP